MDILLFHTDREKMKVLSFCIESQLNVAVRQASSLEQTMSHLLADENVDLIIANESQQLSLLIKYLLSVGSQIPIVVMAPSSQPAPQSFSGIEMIAQVTEAQASTELISVLREKYREIAESPANDSGYCRISVELLCDVTPLVDSVYVRLSNIKYVKLFKAGTVFTERDLRRLCGVRNIEYLYILKSAAGEFIERLQDKLRADSSNLVDGDERLFSTVAYVQETLQDLTQKIGFTPPVVELAKTHVETAVKAIGKFPRLTRIFEGSILRNANYTSKHSVMVAHVACAIASQMGWPSDSTFQKLTIASLLHDLTLAKPEYAHVKTKQDLMDAKSKFLPTEVTSIESHPFAAGELVNKLTEIPGDVYLVVLQHHEVPDGSGFPRGLRASAISPLAAVFIVAHELVDEFEKQGDTFDMIAFFQDREELYSVGTFKKIAKCFLEPAVTKAS